MCDGFGLAQFLKTMAEMIGGAHVPSIQPVWQREIFNARNPPRITCSHLEFEDVPLVSPISECSNIIRTKKEEMEKLGLPLGYYGNAFAYPAVMSKAEVLCKSSLGDVVELIKKAKEQVNVEYMKSVADLMVIRGRPRFSELGNFIVSDNTRLGFDQIDFGWGLPRFTGAATCFSMIISCLVSLEKEGEKGISVAIAFPTELAVQTFQREIDRFKITSSL
ncbi:hypothetical protein F8388_017355 [Cannabis sativa]|uniref:Uncharacterized protein n=1 Tax=Cannabis sativa TaxID=3483 RepID=A0A7J6HB16_CANSA|nr:hypothetical protein F8388_017355 [Cannabis sativa]